MCVEIKTIRSVQPHHSFREYFRCVLDGLPIHCKWIPLRCSIILSVMNVRAKSFAVRTRKVALFVTAILYIFIFFLTYSQNFWFSLLVYYTSLYVYEKKRLYRDVRGRVQDSDKTQVFSHWNVLCLLVHSVVYYSSLYANFLFMCTLVFFFTFLWVLIYCTFMLL